MPRGVPDADALELADPLNGLVELTLVKGERPLARLILEPEDLRALAVNLYIAYEELKAAAPVVVDFEAAAGRA